jgi:anthranilate synthase component 2
VFRNDAITLEEIAAMKPDRIVISPGPCSPAEAGISVAAIKEFAGKIPLLGVCLGHQSIGAAFGGEIVHAKQLMHGKTSPVHHDRQGRLRRPAQSADRGALPLAGDPPRDAAGLPRSHGLDRRRRDHGRAPPRARVEGVQFHPESILTERPRTAENFLKGSLK